jgi:hypothetical protein
VLLIYPLVLGSGERLIREGGSFAELQLVDCVRKGLVGEAGFDPRPPGPSLGVEVAEYDPSLAEDVVITESPLSTFGLHTVGRRE